jgi:hypothetical protein
MSSLITTTFVDDLDGSPAEGTVRFALDGRQYEIDLSEANALKLREQLAPYIEAGRRVVSSAGRAPGRAGSARGLTRDESQAIRAWATEQGIEINQRGRIPKGVLDAYRAGHASS